MWGRAPQVTAAEAVAALGRLVLDFRLIVLLLSMLALMVGEPVPGLTAAILVALLASFVPLMGWRRLAPWLMRHPLVLFADVALTLGILLFTGVDGPFVYYTLGTAFLAGVLYGWVGGVIFPVTLVLGYLYILSLRASIGDSVSGFQAVVGIPSLYLLAGLGAAAIRGVLLRAARAETALAHASERARLAREMHDSLAKTLHGVALAASALPLWAGRDPARLGREARQVAAAAELAAAQARELITNLRTDRLELPLAEEVRRYVEEWSARSGIGVSVDVEAVPLVATGPRYELFCILKEALRNVERHAADASQVEVGLHNSGSCVQLSIADDGPGLAVPVDLQRVGDLDRLTARGHYGLVGMAERAKRAGGSFAVRPRSPHGVEVLAEVSL